MNFSNLNPLVKLILLPPIYQINVPFSVTTKYRGKIINSNFLLPVNLVCSYKLGIIPYINNCYMTKSSTHFTILPFSEPFLSCQQTCLSCQHEVISRCSFSRRSCTIIAKNQNQNLSYVYFKYVISEYRRVRGSLPQSQYSLHLYSN